MNKKKLYGKTPEAPLTEAETRTRMLGLAKRLGCEMDLRLLFERYDKLLKTCKNEVERQQISVMANVELHKLFNFRNPLVVEGREILPGDPGWEDKCKG